MASGNVSAHDWLNRNSHRNYPVVDGVTLRTNAGAALPRGILSDAFISISSGGAAEPYVSSISFTLRTVTVIISDSSAQEVICYATAILGSTKENQGVGVRSSDGVASGSITFGNILDQNIYPDYSSLLGTHTQPSSARLDARCTIFSGRPALKSLSVLHHDSAIKGDIAIAPGTELTIDVYEETVEGQIETVIELGLANPEAFLPDCYPTNTNVNCYCPGTPITAINGVTRNPSDQGIDIVFGNGLDGSITDDQEQYLISLLVEEEYQNICSETPVIPDTFGRIGPEFTNDCPPLTNYGLSDNGPPCRNPPPQMPNC